MTLETLRGLQGQQIKIWFKFGGGINYAYGTLTEITKKSLLINGRYSIPFSDDKVKIVEIRLDDKIIFR